MSTHTPLLRPALVQGDAEQNAAREAQAAEFAKFEQEASGMNGEEEARRGKQFNFSATSNPKRKTEQNAQAGAESQSTATEAQDDKSKAAADEQKGSDDGSGESGENSGDIPGWMKQRLAREKKIQDDQAAQIEALEKKVEELTAGKTGSESKSEAEQAEGKEGDKEKPKQEAKRPERGDYDSDADFLEDVEAFEDGLPLIHDPLGLQSKETEGEEGEGNEGEQQQAAAEGEGAQSKADAEAEAEEAAKYHTQLMKDLRSEMKDAGEEQLQLYTNFTDKLKARDIELTSDMLEYMLTEGDAVAIMQEFVRRPGHARVLAKRATPEERVQGLKDLIAAAQEAATGKTGESEELPDVSQVQSQGNTQGKKLDEMNFQEYQAHAHKLQQQRKSTSGFAVRSA